MKGNRTRAEITDVAPGSIADELGLLPGDLVLRVDGRPMLDVLDYQQWTARERIRLEVGRGDEVFECEIEKDVEESLGIAFTSVVFDGVRRCRNRCAFCFVDNLPKGLRESLYLKDDDYRLSFLHGNFITLGNLREADWQRILRLRLSPLYVSVHATDPEVRARLMGCRGDAAILPGLRRLVEGGTEVHAQIVLCPEANGGGVLDATVRDLAALHPGVASVGVVPVGLTRYASARGVRPVGPPEAARALQQIGALQAEFLARMGARFVFAGDELYLRAGEAVPEADEYEDFPQLSNGVGLIASFRDEEEEALEGIGERKPAFGRVTVVTGTDAAPVVAAFCRRVAAAMGAELTVVPVPNAFFGESVTVAGLLTGQDILSGLRTVSVGELVLVPGVALRDGELFLDGMTIADLHRGAEARVRAAAPTPLGIVEAIMEHEV